MKRREAPLIKVPLVIPRNKAFALAASGSRYITNFDADSAWQAAPQVIGTFRRQTGLDIFGDYYQKCMIVSITIT
jgi:hypothetical protein